jgi:hypothetical protein
LEQLFDSGKLHVRMSACIVLSRRYEDPTTEDEEQGNFSEVERLLRDKGLKDADLQVVWIAVDRLIYRSDLHPVTREALRTAFDTRIPMSDWPDDWENF